MIVVDITTHNTTEKKGGKTCLHRRLSSSRPSVVVKLTTNSIVRVFLCPQAKIMRARSWSLSSLLSLTIAGEKRSAKYSWCDGIFTDSSRMKFYFMQNNKSKWKEIFQGFQSGNFVHVSEIEVDIPAALDEDSMRHI